MKCVACKKHFSKKPKDSWMQYYGRKYCSQACRIKYPRNCPRICSLCGVTFYKNDKSTWSAFAKRRFCSSQCRCKNLSRINKLSGNLPPSTKGKIMGEEQKKRISISNKIAYSDPTKRLAISMRKLGKPFPYIKGDKNTNWKGGITPLSRVIRTLLEYKNWRRTVFERDNYVCLWCGAKSGNGKRVILHTDHIKPLSVILGEYSIRILDDAIKCKELWDTNNGRTLCVNCHRLTKTYKNGAQNYVVAKSQNYQSILY